MLPRKIEEIVAPVVKKFVAETLAGRYQQHCSNNMLEALIIFHLGNPCRRYENRCLAEASILGDGNAAYEAVCWLFEHVLEYKCRAGGNGHHVAQSFSEAMSVLTEPETIRDRG